MTNKISKIALFAALGISASAAIAQVPDNDGYMFDTRGKVARSGFDLCWRTNRWTPAMAIEECDPDLVKKPEPVAAAPAAPAPIPAPIPAPAPKPVAEKITMAADALFDFDKDTLRPEGKAKLDELSSKVTQIKLEVILTVGHADRLGSDQYNQKLSERRAAAVKAYLVGKGVDEKRVYTEGKGETQPVTKAGECKGEKKTKKLVDCLQPDRRVNIEVIGTK